MATVESFVLRFKTEGADVVRNLADDISALGNQFGVAGNTVAQFTSKLGPLGLAATAAAGAFVALGMKAVNMADQIQDLADATGISAGQLKNFKASLIEAGGGVDSFEKFAAKLSVAIGNAAEGNKALRDSFEQLGVYTLDANGNLRDSGDVLEDVIGALARIEDPARRAALATQLMGKEAAKVDWSKVSAGRDAITDAQIAALAKYREEIDKLVNSINDKLIKAFGSLAQAINEGGIAKGLAVITEEMARLIGKIPLLGKPFEYLADQAYAARVGGGRSAGRGGPTAEELAAQARRTAPAAGGRFGGATEEEKRAAEESARRIEQGRLDIVRLLRLQGANQLQSIEINAEEELNKKIAEIRGNKLLTEKAKEEEIQVARVQSALKAEGEITKFRMAQNAKIFAEQEAEREKIAQELAAEERRINQLVKASQQQVEAVRATNQEMALRDDLASRALRMGTIERDLAQQLLDIEIERRRAIQQLNRQLEQGMYYSDFVKQEKALTEAYAERIAMATRAAEQRKAQEQDYQLGLDQSIKRIEEMYTPLQVAKMEADAVWQGMNAGLENFVRTGKLNFADFAGDIIRRLLMIRLQAAASGLFGNILGAIGLGGGGGFGTGSSFGNMDFGGFFANGGKIRPGEYGIVGERGPEIVTGPATVTPMRPQPAVTNVYNISAVDARSVAQLFAENRMSLLGTVRQAEKELPFRGR